MDKKQRIFSVGLVFCMLIVFTFASETINTEEKEEGNKIGKPSLVERFTSLLFVSSPSSSNTPQTSGGNWDKIKAFVNQARLKVSPPNLDFRGSEENEPVISKHGGSSSTAGEKVKEAVTTSLEKTKDAVEDSAKSAAKIAGETAQKTTEKVKKTLSTKQDSEL